MKIHKLTLVVPAALILAGCTLPWASGPITGTEAQKAEKLSQIIAAGGSANCKVTSLTDKTETQIVVKGKKMKLVGSDLGEGKKGTMINDTVYTYFWTEGEKTGFKTKIAEPTATPDAKVTPEADEIEQETSKFEDETKFKMDCVAGTVSDSEFVPPVEVTFTDFSAMQQQIQQQTPQGIPSLPAGVNIPAIPEE